MLFYSSFINLRDEGFTLRLSKVKLSGFKSFVEPTTFVLNGRLNGIVGPNGCGKSNIIDAVRWVMGESSAKQLRGESMSDVIFNGSTHRKPSGFASIELIFDNREGLLGGEWATYAEISIRRLLDRDGKSQYFLNGTRCRRRDITDIFMGTGLGPRSYAIIEQGMISRIVESRPEELRTFFEEAASISKYKERRRETELRIKHTRENLDRLSDVRVELGKQLERLEKQAETAIHYQTLKKEERSLDYWRIKAQRESVLEKLETLTETGQQKHDEFQASLETLTQLTERLSEAKAAFEAEERALEAQNRTFYQEQQAIESLKHSLTMLRELKMRDSKSLDEWNERADTLKAEIAKLRERLVILTHDETELDTTLIMQEEALFAKEEALQTLLNRADSETKQERDLKAALSKLEHTITLNKQRMQFEEDRIAQLKEATLRLENERDNLPDLKIARKNEAALSDEVAIIADDLIALSADEGELEIALNESLSLLAAHNREKQALLNERSELNGKVNALKALMAERAKRHAKVEAPLFEKITIEGGWNKAFDHVLSRYLEISTDHNHPSFIGGECSITYQETQLGYYLKSDLELGALLSHVYLLTDAEADDPAAIKARQNALKPHEWLVNKEGDLFGKDWQIAFDDAKGIESILAQEGEIETAEERVSEIDLAVSLLDEKIGKLEDEKAEQQAALGQLKAMIKARNDERFEKEKALSLIKQETAQVDREQKRIEADSHRVSNQLIDAQKTISDLLTDTSIQHESLSDAVMAHESFAETLAKTLEKAESERTQFDHEKSSLMEKKHQLDQIQREKAHVEAGIKRAETELQSIHQRVSETDIRSDYDDKIEEKEASLILAEESFMALTERLDADRIALEEKREGIKADEAAKEASEKALESAKNALQGLMIKEAELKTQHEMVEASWCELNDNLTDEERALLDVEHESLTETELKKALTSVREALNKIGAVNLVAIEESKTLRERKTYLDAQDEDLNRALTTLENAIKQIDKETRERFMETFNQVSKDFSTLFPRLFGGGKAYLQLTDDDALTSGVNIIAHPPGKKPGTIHLLSGGEKAMTAMALVFAIFNLNPAPFCMLDEVDAPLDEANVGRLGDLLNEMSEKVQFIFITHNKATMSISDSLIGVTMSEPGVSRIVSVNLAEALEYSESA